MSYEIDSIKRELNSLRYELTRKVDDQDFRNRLNHLEQKLERQINNLPSTIEELNQKLDRFIETYEQERISR